ILAAAGDMLNSLALILMQKFLDLTLVVGGFVQRYPNLSAWARQRPRIKSRVFPGNVEKADLPEIEEVLIEAIPAVHGAAKNIVGQVIDIKQTATGRGRIALARPIEFAVVGRTLGAKSVDEIDQAAADPEDCRSINRRGAILAIIGLSAAF